jgi:HEAT repeat protein
MNTNVAFQQIIAALLDTTKPFPPTYLHQFSDIRPPDLKELKKIWDQINIERRVNLMDDLEDLMIADTLVCFDDVARFALNDPEPRVRVIAIRMLLESEDHHLLADFTRLSREDLNSEVRGMATAALGYFVFQGELEELPADKLTSLEEHLLGIMANGKEPDNVRRSALEALGFSSRDEVPALINNAFATNRVDWQESALLAMGRSLDQRWEPFVLKMLDHTDVAVRVQAIRAAGELESKSARQPLLRLLKNYRDEDEDVRSAAIWSLSQIGGERVREALEALSELSEDDEEISFIDDALENLNFTEDYSRFDMVDVGAAGNTSDEDEVEEEDEDDLGLDEFPQGGDEDEEDENAEEDEDEDESAYGFHTEGFAEDDTAEEDESF